MEGNKCDLVLFNMVLDSKFCGCDLVKLFVLDVMLGGVVMWCVFVI